MKTPDQIAAEVMATASSLTGPQSISDLIAAAVERDRAQSVRPTRTPIAVAMDVFAEDGERLSAQQLMTKAIETDRAQRPDLIGAIREEIDWLRLPESTQVENILAGSLERIANALEAAA